MVEAVPDNAEEPHRGDPSPAKTLNPEAIRGGRPEADDLAALRAKASIANALFSASVAGPDPVHTLGRYRLERELGAGGMGVVYEAFDPELERSVAVKVLHPQTAADEVARARMVREARAMARVSHPNVIAVYDVGDEDGQVFVAMELVEGQTLTRWLADEQLSLDSIMERFLAAGEGLWAAHQCELVHRDFKPDNVLVGADGRVRVLDFGLARNLQTPELDALGTSSADRIAQEKAAVTAITQAGSLVGTPRYMAPEQFHGSAADAKSDQYSFGVALFEGLYGAPPFTGDSVGELIRRIVAGEKTDQSTARQIPPALVRVVDRAMSPSPEDRFEDMGSLLAALRGASGSAGIGVRRRVLWGIAGLLGAAAIALIVAAAVREPKAGERGREAAVEGAVAVLDGPTESASVERLDVGGAPPERADSEQDSTGESESVGEPDPGGEPDSGDDAAETGAEMTVPEPPKRITDWCYMHEDGYKLLHRGEKKTSKLRKKGDCYRCRRERSKSRIGRFSPADCGGYLVCGPEECG